MDYTESEFRRKSLRNEKLTSSKCFKSDGNYVQELNSTLFRSIVNHMIWSVPERHCAKRQEKDKTKHVTCKYWFLTISVWKDLRRIHRVE
jgi:hypothetical protein